MRLLFLLRLPPALPAPQPKYSDYVFDGFMHRSFDDNLDGWRNEMLDPPEVVEMARQVLDLYNGVNRLRRENWELRKGKHG